jgi:cytochrome c oxidase subunit IV
VENTTRHIESTPHGGYRLYWITWGILLVITLIMLVTDSAPVPRWVLLGVLLVAMLVKAAFIAGNFMHLRFEHPGLVAIVAGSLLLVGLAMYMIFALDAHHILEHTQ